MSERYRKLIEGLYEVRILDASDEELKEINKDRMMALSLDEMKRIQNYFKKERRNPTDIELEAIAQAWSEHCCYKTSKPFLRKTVFNIKAPQSICIISEDAGVVDFNEDYAYVVGLESHNHPSALDPYGGAATGVGGILRDVVCMGAQPIALIDPLFFGPLDLPEDKVSKGVKHPRYLFRGVVKGIGDYGNKVGIPTVAGQISFDESYTSNCLVNVGCIGIIRKDKILHSRAGAPGELFILAGGKTGRDGIHGVTFASLELKEDSEETSRPAVQLGDPITKEPLIHACLEINENGLATGMKDFGGGGLSCVASEMAHAAGYGIKINLDKVPLKVQNMVPWEIWVSESQERMMLTCKKENLEKIMDVFRLWEVEASVLGEVTDTKRAEVYYKNKRIYDLDLDFHIKAVEYNRPFKVVKKEPKEETFPQPKDLNVSLLNLLSDQNICSKEWVVRQYDHEVRANTVTKIMQGSLFSPGPGDAVVLKPVEGSWKGLAITSDVNPQFTKLDPYWGSAAAIDESVRNLVAVGARPHSFADNLNFGNPEKEERLGDFSESVDGLYDLANELGIPYVSGNVSLYNESHTGAIAPTPTILAIGIIEDVRKAVTMDFKAEGNTIYIIGKTFKELGGSAYAKLFKETGKLVPQTDSKELKVRMNAILDSMDKKLVSSCHDISNGGFAVAVAEMCIASDFGADIDFDLIPAEEMRDDFRLFSETNTRWILEVKKENISAFEEVLKKHNVEFSNIGKVTKEKRLKIGNLIDIEIEKLRKSWSGTIPKFMGETQ